MLINNVLSIVQKEREKIEVQAREYGYKWKRVQLKALQKESIQLVQKAIDEAQNIVKEYENKVKEIENRQYQRTSATQEEIVNLEYDLKVLKAELNMSETKSDVIERYLQTKSGAKAVLMMFADPNVDIGYWTKDIYAKASMMAKSQAEIDFDLKKQKEVETLKSELSEMVNTGSLLAAQKVLTGSADWKIPSLERQFENDILECDRHIID